MKIKCVPQAKLVFRMYFVAIVVNFSLSGCKKFVEIGPPQTQLVTASVFNNNSTATAAQTTIYSRMATNGESFYMAQYSGLLSDELTNYSTNLDIGGYYTNSMNASATPSYGRWFYFYSDYIYPANAIIGALQNNGSISQEVSQQLTGEAEFIRAFWMFYLTNCYGNIPIVTTTDYTINESIARSPQTQVYQQIISDLTNAEQLLNNNYVDGSDTTITTERTRPNKPAAEALLARVYLYYGKYDSAQFFSSEVINNSLYKICSNLSPLMGSNSVFLTNSSEAIFQLATPQPSSINTEDGQNFILTGAPRTGIVNCTTISPQLINSFEVGDLRKTNWIGSYSPSPSINYYFPYKYQSYSQATVTEYVMVLRLAEQYLIRAEAEARLGDSTDAMTDLNVIRSRAGLGNYSLAKQGPLLAAILHEKQVELFSEWGHRWFDLIRTGAIDTVMGGPGNVYNAKGGTGSWNPDWELYPVASSQIGLDPNLTQNPGY